MSTRISYHSYEDGSTHVLQAHRIKKLVPLASLHQSDGTVVLLNDGTYLLALEPWLYFYGALQMDDDAPRMPLAPDKSPPWGT